MVLAVGLNAIMFLAMAIVILFCAGDLDRVTSAQMPILEVYYQATKSKWAANNMVLMQALIFLVSLFNTLASISRLYWGFARDKGLPFSTIFSYVSLEVDVYLSRRKLTLEGPSNPEKPFGIPGSSIRLPSPDRLGEYRLISGLLRAYLLAYRRVLRILSNS